MLGLYTPGCKYVSLTVMPLPFADCAGFPLPKSTVTLVIVLLSEEQVPVAVEFRGAAPAEGFIVSLHATGELTVTF